MEGSNFKRVYICWVTFNYILSNMEKQGKVPPLIFFLERDIQGFQPARSSNIEN